MPRLFTGLEIPGRCRLRSRPDAGRHIAGARWIDRESYHITLRFIGDIDDGLAREIAYELEGVEARPFHAAADRLRRVRRQQAPCALCRR